MYVLRYYFDFFFVSIVIVIRIHIVFCYSVAPTVLFFFFLLLLFFFLIFYDYAIIDLIIIFLNSTFCNSCIKNSKSRSRPASDTGSESNSPRSKLVFFCSSDISFMFMLLLMS
jgi:hypothetical protein